METPMVNEANAHHAGYAAACPRCHGWMPCSGMSRFADTAWGCICHSTVAREALAIWRTLAAIPAKH
jgi:hypothetical protein